MIRETDQIESELKSPKWTNLTWVELASSLLSGVMSLCSGVRGFPTSEWVAAVFFEFLAPAVANCSNAFSNPVMALWMLEIFFGFLCFFFSPSSVKFGGTSSASRAADDKEWGGGAEGKWWLIKFYPFTEGEKLIDVMSFEIRGSFMKLKRNAHHNILLGVFAASLAHAHRPEVS